MTAKKPLDPIKADIKSRAIPGSHTQGERALYRDLGVQSDGALRDIRAHETTRDENRLPTVEDRKGARHSQAIPDFTETPGMYLRSPTAPMATSSVDDTEERLALMVAGLSTDAQWLYQVIQAGLPTAVWRDELGDKTDTVLAEIQAALSRNV